MKSRFLALLLLAGGTMFAGPRFFGVGYSGYYAPAPVYAYGPPPVARVPVYRPAYPGPGYAWVGGYYYPAGRSYYWRSGYWARRPYVGARWIAPRYFSHRWYGGYWRR